MQADIAPHGRIGGGQTGEVTEAGGRIFDDFRFGHRLQIVRRADDVVGDDMRQMRDDRQNLVVVFGIHFIDTGTKRPPEILQLFQRLGVRTRQRREDAPALAEEAGKTGIRAGFFRTRQRMSGNEMHIVWHMRRHLRDDRGLGGTDIGNDRAGFQMRCDLLRDTFRCADRDRNDDEIGILHGLRRRDGVIRTERQFFRPFQRFLAAGGNRDMPRKPQFLDVAGNRRANEADADQRDAFEHDLAHYACPINSVSAAMTPRLASSEPTVIRKALGKPYPRTARRM